MCLILKVLQMRKEDDKDSQEFCKVSFFIDDIFLLAKRKKAGTIDV